MLWNALVLLIAMVPLSVVIFLNYRRWQKQYGPNATLISYYFRYMTAKKATDDTMVVYIAKSAFCVVWAVMVIGFLWSAK
jgi:hypothetical protein